MSILRLAIFQVVIASMLATVATATSTVTLQTYSGVYPGLGGGEFTAFTSDNYVGNYASAATYSGGFETFCIETGVEFTPGHQYYYTLGNVAMPIPAAGAGSAIPLSLGAAWLYYEFGTGHLNSFDYSYGSTRQANATSLQAAIWALQGGQTYGSYPNGGAGNTYYDEALAALGGAANADSAYTGTTVQILQMWANADDTGAAQNQLVLTGGAPPTPNPSVPDGGMTVFLLGGALVGLQALRRKLCC